MQKLYIPQGIREESEFFDGFGKKEMGNTALTVLIGAGLAFLLYSLFQNLVVSMSTVLISGAVGISLFTKIENISLFARLCGLLAYRKSQKFYRYAYLNEWSSSHDSHY